MAYDVTTVTIKGTELLAAASAANNLLVAGCDATQTYIAKAAAVNVSARPANPFSNTTNVRLEGATDGHIFIRIFFVATESTGGDVRSLYLYGHSANDPSNDYVIAVMSSEDPFHLPEPGDISNTYGTLLDIKFNVADGSVSSVTTSVFATYSEYADIRDRAVTCHKQGQPTVGDNQTIFGNKTFVHPIYSVTEEGVSFVKNWGDYSLQIGEMSEFDQAVGSDIKTCLHSNISFSSDNSDIRSILLSSSTSENAIIRSFGLVSEAFDNNSYTVVANTENQIRSKFFNGTEFQSGGIVIKATDSGETKTAKIEAKVDFEEGNPITTYSYISSESETLELKHSDEIRMSTSQYHCYVYNDYSDQSAGSVVITVNGSQFVVNNSISDSISASLVFTNDGTDSYTLYPNKSAGVSSFNLGASNSKFDNAYATTFHGAFDGNATSATNDANGNAITDYIKQVAQDDADTKIGVWQGTGNKSVLDFNSIFKYIAQGLTKNGDSNNSALGAICLCVYIGSQTSTDKLPGDLILGTDLRPACVGIDTVTNTLHLKYPSSGTLSGTWTLLSHLAPSSGYDTLCLVVKTSLTAY